MFKTDIPESFERTLRRMLCSKVGGHLAYMDDGEAQLCEHGITIDFLRDTQQELEAKVTALNLKRMEAWCAASNETETDIQPLI